MRIILETAAPGWFGSPRILAKCGAGCRKFKEIVHTMPAGAKIIVGMGSWGPVAVKGDRKGSPRERAPSRSVTVS
jgi:hypothetical protein